MKEKETRVSLIADLPLVIGIIITALKWCGLLPSSWHMVLGYWLGLILISICILAGYLIFDVVTGLIEYLVKAFKGRWYWWLVNKQLELWANIGRL